MFTFRVYIRRSQQFPPRPQHCSGDKWSLFGVTCPHSQAINLLQSKQLPPSLGRAALNPGQEDLMQWWEHSMETERVIWGSVTKRLCCSYNWVELVRFEISISNSYACLCLYFLVQFRPVYVSHLYSVLVKRGAVSGKYELMCISLMHVKTLSALHSPQTTASCFLECHFW